MISLLPSSFFFFMIMVFGVFFSISSSNWFLVWCGLEMNLMGFIPIIIQYKGLNEVEAAVKYFLVQSLGSAFILLGSFFIYMSFFWGDYVSAGSPFILMGLFIKLGVFPFHFWLPSVMMSMDWFSCLLIVTWQKLAPAFVLLCYVEQEVYIFLVMGVMSSLVGGLMGINQVNMKSLIAYSSIGHMGWIVAVSFFSLSVGFLYVFLYIVVNLMIFYSLIKINLNWIKSLSNVTSGSQLYIMLLSLSFLTISGIPPLLGFFPKIFSLEALMGSGVFLGSILLVLGTCFSLYYYVSLFLNCTLSLSMMSDSFWKSSNVTSVMFMMLLVNIFCVTLMLCIFYAVIIFY